MLDKTSDLDPRPPTGSGGRSSGSGGRRSVRSAREALQPDAPPPPPKPTKRKRRPIVATASGLLSFIGIAAIALTVAWSLGVQRLNAPGPLTSDKVVAVEPGSDAAVVSQLTEAGVVDSGILMTATLWLERDNIKSGEYMFKQAASLRDVIDLLVSGKQILHSITIPEGLTSEQVVERLRENDVLLGDVAAVPPEGTLMPDTYKFSRGTTREQAIRTMQSEQRKILSEVWARRATDTPIRSPFELVTLASIVEKETGRADERPRVAGVFVNRLLRNMPLQSDPTIVYGLVGGKGTLGRGILKSELDQKTPYNTYQIVGLPPGPIANPGKAALEAVANPSRTKDLYFVADGTGGHAFADNLDQHRFNVQRWRQIEKDAKDKLVPEASPAGSTGPALPKSNQRGDNAAAAAVYGSLDLDISGTRYKPPASVTSLPIAPPANAAAPAFASPPALDVEVAGMKSRADPATWDGDGDGGPVGPVAADPGPGGEGSLQSFPVSPQHLADQRARAIAYGLLPAGAPLPASAESFVPPPGSGAAPRPAGKPRVIDASEGTNLDPLKDKTYDLSFAKIVPPIKALPPVQPIAAAN